MIISTHLLTFNMEKPKFTCKKCHRVFVREKSFLSHVCKQMKREQEAKSVIGQVAFEYYQTWLRLQNRMPPSIDTFISSNYFKTFFKFADFVKQMKLPIPHKFIRFMIDKKYQPTMWTNDEVYVQYMNFLDANADPTDLIKLSVKTLVSYSIDKNIDVSNVFDYMPFNEVLHMIRIRQLSPWLLLMSSKFKEIVTKCSTEQRMILETIIKPDFWNTKLINMEPSTKDLIKYYIQELRI